MPWIVPSLQFEKCNEAYLKLECDFNNRADRAYFFYSLDGESWLPLGEQLQMTYTLPHFMGYRFALVQLCHQDGRRLRRLRLLPHRRRNQSPLDRNPQAFGMSQRRS